MPATAICRGCCAPWRSEETFLAEVYSDQTIYLSDPAPAVPAPIGEGKTPGRLQAQTPPLTVAAWAAAQPASRGCRLSVREGEKGEVVADYLKQRVWLWDGVEQRARCWHLLVRREIDGAKLKFACPMPSPRPVCVAWPTCRWLDASWSGIRGCQGGLSHGGLSAPGLAGVATTWPW